MNGWSHSDRSASRRRILGRRLGALLLLFPLLVGLVGVPDSPTAPGIVRGDELSDAKAKQAQLKKDIAAQKAQVAQLNALQSSLADGIAQTADQLKGINTDLAAVKVKIKGMEAKVAVVKTDYEGLVQELATLDGQLVGIEAQETAKRTELAERKALLADRLRSAYDTDRTSLLESFLSGGTFTDLLAEMSHYLDVGEQDKALADPGRQGPGDARRAPPDDASTRGRGPMTCASRRPPRSARSTRASRRSTPPRLPSRSSRSGSRQSSRSRSASTSSWQRNKAAAKRAIAKAGAAQKKLKDQINALIRKQMQGGSIPSQYNGTLSLADVRRP